MLIGELAAAAHVTPQALRFYEREGLVPPPERLANGYRDYDQAVASRVAFIKSAQSDGFTLAEIRDILHTRDDGQAPCGQVRRLIEAKLAGIEQRLRNLAALHDTLTGLRRRADQVDPGTCPPGSVCNILR